MQDENEVDAEIPVFHPNKKKKKRKDDKARNARNNNRPDASHGAESEREIRITTAQLSVALDGTAIVSARKQYEIDDTIPESCKEPCVGGAAASARDYTYSEVHN